MMPDKLHNELHAFVRSWLEKPASPDVKALAEAIRPQHSGVAAVLAYGSCIRGESVKDTLVDFYVLTDDFKGVSDSLVSRMGCALVPPNVYYFETKSDGQSLRAKYAALPLSQFSDWVGPTTRNPYFWARFAQPSQLVWCRSKADSEAVVAAIATAIETGFAHAQATTPSTDAVEIWTSGFKATYDTEWRSERQGRADQIVSTYSEYYEDVTPLLQAVKPIKINLPLRRFIGKLWATARLIKASFTFKGGADYLVWKIERHSGVKVELTDWQRRHPVVAGLMLLSSLRKRGAIR